MEGRKEGRMDLREREGRRERGRENVDLAMYLETVRYGTGLFSGSGVAFVIWFSINIILFIFIFSEDGIGKDVLFLPNK